MVFGHISTVAFLILGFSFVRIMTSMTSLIAINKSDSKEHVKFYWPHTIFTFITVFTMISALKNKFIKEKSALDAKPTA